MTIELPQGVSAVVKKGQTYYRFRWTVAGKRQEKILPGITGQLTDTVAISEAVEAILRGEATKPVKPQGAKLIERRNVANPGTLGLAWRLYTQTNKKWLAAEASTQRNRRDIVELFLDTHVIQGEAITWKEVAFADISRKALNALLDTCAPSQALKLLRAIKALAQVAIDEEWIKVEQNPTYGMTREKTRGRWKAWPADQMAAYELRHQLGTPARTAYELTKWLGQRQGDVSKVQVKHIQTLRHMEGNRIVAERFVVIEQEKNAKRRIGGAKVAPVLVTPMLLEAIAHVDLSDPEAYLLTGVSGKPLAKSGMTTYFADWREQAGLSRSGYSQHGLRKVLGSLMATAGATTKENMAVLGHDDMKSNSLYSVDADDVRLSASAGKKVVKFVRGKVA